MTEDRSPEGVRAARALNTEATRIAATEEALMTMIENTRDRDGGDGGPNRTKWVTIGASALAAAAVAALVFVVVRDDEPTSVGETPTTTSTPDVTSPPTNPPVTNPPETTVTTIPETSTTPATYTTVPPIALRGPIMAITADGDAVIADEGTVTVLYDGPDPDDAQPDEGPVWSVDGVAATEDGATVFIGACCEPVAGSLLVSSPPAAAEANGFGHAPALAPDQQRLARIMFDQIMVSDLDLAPLATATLDLAQGTPVSLAWTDDTRLVMLLEVDGGVVLQAFDVADGALTAAQRSDVIDGVYTLAGASPTHTWLLPDGGAELLGYDATTLAADASADITLLGPALSAWTVGEIEVRWIDTNRKLHLFAFSGMMIHEEHEFIWVR